jgi:hypothetical protein
MIRSRSTGHSPENMAEKPITSASAGMRAKISSNVSP